MPSRRSLLVSPLLLPLAVLANESAAVLDRVRTLKAGEAALLGNSRVLGPFNETARVHGLHLTGPRARDYSIKMVWAPDLRRSLFAGANHGGPHRLNDVWAFDLAAFTWVLLYAPDLSRSYLGLGDDASDVEYRDGLLVTRRGGPAIIAHTWWGLTYDPVQRRLLFMNTWVADAETLIRSLGADPTDRYKGPPLWTFDGRAARWKPVRSPRPWPPAPFGGLLEAVPALGGVLWHMNNWQMRATWLLDTATGLWRDLRANADSGDFSKQAPAAEAVGYHDAQRSLIVARRGQVTHHFDISQRRWRRVEAIDDAAAPAGHDALNPLYHDAVSGEGLLVDSAGAALWAYDPDRPRWRRLQPRGDPMPTGPRRLACVDAAHNVLLVIADTRVWAYRHRMT